MKLTYIYIYIDSYVSCVLAVSYIIYVYILLFYYKLPIIYIVMYISIVLCINRVSYVSDNFCCALMQKEGIKCKLWLRLFGWQLLGKFLDGKLKYFLCETHVCIVRSKKIFVQKIFQFVIQDCSPAVTMKGFDFHF